MSFSRYGLSAFWRYALSNYVSQVRGMRPFSTDWKRLIMPPRLSAFCPWTTSNKPQELPTNGSGRGLFLLWFLGLILHYSGSFFEWHSRGRGFDSHRLHHDSQWVMVNWPPGRFSIATTFVSGLPVFVSLLLWETVKLHQCINQVWLIGWYCNDQRRFASSAVARAESENRQSKITWSLYPLYTGQIVEWSDRSAWPSWN